MHTAANSQFMRQVNLLDGIDRVKLGALYNGSEAQLNLTKDTFTVIIF